MLKKVLSGVCAGLLITLGGSVFLACKDRYVGAVLFSVALLCICMKGYALFTGKVGFIVTKHDREDWSQLLLCLLGNLLGTVLGGLLVRCALPDLGAAAQTLCVGKLAQTGLQTFLRGMFCGVLMYLAVSIYRDRKDVIGILFCIPVFILSGFEHSIADMFYFAAAGSVSTEGFVFIWLVILGNSLGGILLPILERPLKEA